MKKIFRFIFLFVFIFTFPFVAVNAGGKSDDSTNTTSNEPIKPLTCVYGPLGNDYYRIVQTADGNIKWQMTNRANVDYTDLSSASDMNWGGDSVYAGNSTVFSKPLVFSETTKYVNNHLTDCPDFLVSTDDSGWVSNWNKNFFKDEEENCDSRFKICLKKVFESENIPTAFNDPTASYEGLDDITECVSLLGHPDTEGEPAFYLVKAFHVLKYVALVLLVVLSIMDFTTEIAKQDKDSMAKLLKKIMMRFILCIIIFLLPYFVNLLLKYLVSREIGLCNGNW